ncbi:MAG: hypothetical protein HFG00_05565 [Oscillibacter sp.]|nr:hypothetical protein [Oscillibacter sp.]
MFNTSKQLEWRKKLERYVDQCELKVPEEVARLFKEYTLLVWDFKLLGRIYDFYRDDAIMYVEDGETVVGVEEVVANTLAFTAAVPDNESWFIDIFAEGDPERGYYFIQSTRCVGTSTGPSKLGPGTGRSLSEGGRDCIGLCECHVENVDGKWKITEEWMVRSDRAIGYVMDPAAPPLSFDGPVHVMPEETVPYRGWKEPENEAPQEPEEKRDPSAAT